MQVPFSPETRTLAHAVKTAGLYLWGETEKNIQLSVSVKADFSIVLNLDLESERSMMESLKGTLPIVSEEDDVSHALIGSKEEYYLIDPVDGTTSCKRFLTMVGGHVGFGPLGGFVKGGKLWAASFFNIPQRSLFISERGVGSYQFLFTSKDDAALPVASLRGQKLQIKDDLKMQESAVLFYAGIGGELKVIEGLKRKNLIENIYRFGGFANDCTRLALGTEQLQVQFAVKAWDLPAALITELAGLSVLVDPAKSKISLKEWYVASANPLIAAPPSLLPILSNVVDEALDPKFKT